MAHSKEKNVLEVKNAVFNMLQTAKAG